jgi:hypothetical protein
MHIWFNDFITFCRSLSGQTLHTLSRKLPFEFEMHEEHEVKFCFTPMSTSGPRTVRQRYTEEYINQFNTNGGSLRPGDYDVGVNASYMVTLFKLYQDYLLKKRRNSTP